MNKLQDSCTLRQVPVTFTGIDISSLIQNYFQFEYIKNKIKFIILFFYLSLQKSLHHCGRKYNTKQEFENKIVKSIDLIGESNFSRNILLYKSTFDFKYATLFNYIFFYLWIFLREKCLNESIINKT